ncbi:acyl carrier protein [Amycolatopsis pretoriensis]|uniref:Acyl carrier protein n=1 Tax=Amycolatopsis pretoriensis TaxID=218821 RepID=A0A1H5QJR1_9PSEU|nr:phosphopantetheine-binding protein [Amycolatopsis pretoriensis]SEF26275.1 acyl carrier protein [Amycolatopsis pretoriensis]
MTIDHSTAVFDVVAELLTQLTGDADVLGIDITPDTTFHEDLQLESIDLVTFASILSEHFGADVNLAEYLAEKDLDDVIGLTVGDIARFVGERTCPR